MIFDAKPRSAETDALEDASHSTQPDIAHQPVTLSGLEQTLASKEGLKAVVQGVSDPIQGIGEGALETVHGVGELIRKGGNLVHNGLGDEIVPPTGQHALQQIATPDNTVQTIGKVGEGIAEFMFGDAALKSLPILVRAEKALEAKKAAQIAIQKSPALARVFQMGLHALESAGISAGQAELHGENPVRAAEGGAVGSAAGETLGAVGSLLTSRTKNAAQQAAAKIIENTEAIKRGAAITVTSAAGTSVEAATGKVSDASTFQQAADEIKTHFTKTYDKLRELTGGVWNPKTERYGEDNAFDLAVKQIKRAKKVIYSPSPASTDAIKAAEKELAEGEAKLDSLFGQGSTESADAAREYAAAQAGWRKASTLEDLHDIIDKSFTEPASVRKLSGYGGQTPTGTLDLRKFVTRANKAIDKLNVDNKLRDAMGDSAFQQLETVRREFSLNLDNDKYTKTLAKLTQEQLAKHPVSSSTSKTLGFPAVAGTVGPGVHFLLGASNPVSAGIGLTAGAAHYLWTHPELGAPIAKAAAALAPAAGATAGRMLTHQYDPATGKVSPVTSGDAYANDPSFEMSGNGSLWETYPTDQPLADAVIKHEGRGKEKSNPGNLKFAGQKGAVPGIAGFARFNSEQEGRAALITQLAKWRRENPTMTPEDFAKRYSPDTDPLNPVGTEAAYVAALTK